MATSSSQAVANNYTKQVLHHLTRTGNLFVIHFTKEMFLENGGADVYFHQCLKTYVNILKRKLSNNKDDYMGLMFCNTIESDEGAENILTVHKLSACTTNMYTDIMKLYDKNIEHYRNQISGTNCSIANVLLHAVRAYDAVSMTTVARSVILITCDDNPARNDSKEQHRIRLNATNYKDMNVQLKIIGLGEKWDYDVFYKEIEMLSEKTAGRDFKRINLADLEEDIIFRAHVVASLEFRIRDNANIKVSLQGFITHSRYMKTKSMDKDTNQPLDAYSWYSYEPDEEGGDYDHDNTAENVFKMQRFGGKDIVYTCNEIRSLYTMKKPGIDLLGFKTMSVNIPTYQIQPVLFVGCNPKASAGELKFFAALLLNMTNKNLMAICALTFKLNARTRLFMMWPCKELGGFYLYRMPFKEDVRTNMSSIMDKYVFNEDDKLPPASEEKLDIMKSIVETLYVERYPIDFLNTRLQRILKSVEAVALDLPPVEPPEDNTLPDFNSMRNKLNELNLIDQYNNTFDEIEEPIKQQASKVRKLDNEYVNNVLAEGNFHQLTAVTLKSILRTLGQSASGNKADLVNKVNEYKKKHF